MCPVNIEKEVNEEEDPGEGVIRLQLLSSRRILVAPEKYYDARKGENALVRPHEECCNQADSARDLVIQKIKHSAHSEEDIALIMENHNSCSVRKRVCRDVAY